MTDTNNERPLVTFVLFAYNQEKYIREAIEGAFSQTYEPLEIILSDDCSTDKTFEIMQEMTAAYEGPHEVRVRRNAFNIGTALHVQSAFTESRGELFVVAAGDDISISSRVSILVDAWLGAGSPDGVIHSGREVFRGGQTIAVELEKRYRCSDSLLRGYKSGYWLPASPPTCAYTRNVFGKFGPLLGGSIIEDAPLQLRCALIGKFIFCKQPLVRKRMHDCNGGTGYVIDAPARWNRFVQSKIIAFRNMQIDLAKVGDDLDPETSSRIEQRILAVLSSAPGLFLPEKRSISRFEQLRLAYKIATAPAVARTFRLRIEYALSFFGFAFHLTLKEKFKSALNRVGSI